MSNIKEILEKNGFAFSKCFGQNFLSDKNLLRAIVSSDAKVQKTDEVLEIGPGAGALTCELCEVAKKVVCYEIDKTLEPVLGEVLQGYSNKQIIFADALKTDSKQIESNFDGDFKIVANIPYYITSPLVMKFLGNKKVVSMTLMVQKEVAERICAKPKTSDYGFLSVMCQHYCECKICRIVPKTMFYPAPKVDSAIITLVQKPDCGEFNESFDQFAKICFSAKRKTLANNLSKNFAKATIFSAVKALNLSESVRAEELMPSELFNLMKLLTTK